MKKIKLSYNEKIQVMHPNDIGFDTLGVVNGIIGYYVNTASDEPFFMQEMYYKDLK